MSTTKHTPGPWVLNGNSGKQVVVVGDNEIIAPNGSWNHSDEQDFADARLIAAAPELLEALEAVLRFDANMPGEYKHDVTLAIKVRKAISKATNATL